MFRNVNVRKEYLLPGFHQTFLFQALGMHIYYVEHSILLYESKSKKRYQMNYIQHII